MSMNEVRRDVNGAVIEGRCDSRFEQVLDAFEKNFAEREEVGSSCCVTLEGETVVDIWGGHKKPDGDAWAEDTVSIVFSCTKGATALCAHMLADRGLLDLDAPVAEYWPEFAQNGKENATVSMMLDHSVGVAHIRQTLKDGAYLDWDYMTDLVAREDPFWEPGTRNGYHGVTFAWTVGEIVRRAAGKPMGQFFAEEVAGPLGLDFTIGTPASTQPRIAPMIAAQPDPNAPLTKFTQKVISDPTSLPYLFLMNNGGADFNSPDLQAVEIGSANGITNARGLAGMYAPLANGGSLDGVKLVGADSLARMGQTAMATHEDATLMIRTRFSEGFMKAMDNRKVADSVSLIIGERAFGHVGMGGHLGMADPDVGMSFGYTMNRMGMGILMNDRGQSLVDATYKSLGYRSDASGAWIV